MRLAILADIHGNLPALEAVVEELERLQPDHVVVDGDLINAVPYSTEVIDFIRGQRWVVIRGNHEFYYLDFGTERAIPGCEDPDRWGQLHWLVENITPAQGQYLAMLPDDCTLYLPGTAPLRIVHGVPGRNRTGFYRSQADAAIAAEILGVRVNTPLSRPIRTCRSIAMLLWKRTATAASPPTRMRAPTFTCTVRGCIGTGTSSIRAAWVRRWTSGRWPSSPCLRACRSQLCAGAGR